MDEWTCTCQPRDVSLSNGFDSPLRRISSLSHVLPLRVALHSSLGHPDWWRTNSSRPLFFQMATPRSIPSTFCSYRYRVDVAYRLARDYATQCHTGLGGLLWRGRTLEEARQLIARTHLILRQLPNRSRSANLFSSLLHSASMANHNAPYDGEYPPTWAFF